MNTTSIPPEYFETETILGRKPVMADAPAIFETYATDPEVTRFLVFEPYQKIEDLERWLKQTIREWDGKPGNMYLLFKRENPEALVGSFSIRIAGGKAEIGYLIARPYWGRGIMTEVVRYWVDWALSKPDIFRIGAFCDVENPASGRVMEKAGMAFEGTLKRYSIHPNLGKEPRDVNCFAKTR